MLTPATLILPSPSNGWKTSMHDETLTLGHVLAALHVGQWFRWKDPTAKTWESGFTVANGFEVPSPESLVTGGAVWDGTPDAIEAWLATSPQPWEIEVVKVCEVEGQNRPVVVAALEGAL